MKTNRWADPHQGPIQGMRAVEMKVQGFRGFPARDRAECTMTVVEMRAKLRYGAGEPGAEVAAQIVRCKNHLRGGRFAAAPAHRSALLNMSHWSASRLRVDNSDREPTLIFL